MNKKVKLVLILKERTGRLAKNSNMFDKRKPLITFGKMNFKRPNKALELKIKQAVKKLLCPIHNKTASISMESENEEVQVEACCIFFKKDVMIVGERMRKDFLYKDEKTRERLERERKKGLN